MRKFKKGDFVCNVETGENFVIKVTKKCGNILYDDCIDSWDVDSGCPGYINGTCFGRSDLFAIKLLAVQDDNSNIIISERI